MNFAGTTAFYWGGGGGWGEDCEANKKAQFYFNAAKTTQKSRENLVNFGGGYDDILDVSQQYTNFARLRSLLNFTFN